MKIINRGGAKVFWRVFAAGNTDHIAGLQEGHLDNGADATYSAGQSVQMEIKYPASLPKLSFLSNSIVDASPNTTFQDSSRIVFNGNKLVELDSDIQTQIGYNPPQPGAPPSVNDVKLDVMKIATAALNLAQTLVLGMWPKAQDPTKWVPAAGFSIAASLVSIFSAGTSGNAPDPLNVADIEDALQTVIDQDDARNQVSIILNVLDWYNSCLAKSAQQPPSLDQQQFATELTEHLDPTDLFQIGMRLLRDNRDIRKYAIPVYLTGVMLDLHLHRLNLWVTAAAKKTGLNTVDIQTALNLKNAYQNTMDELEQDYVGVYQTLYNKYPLTPGFENYGKPTSVFPPFAEAEALAKYAIIKWLAGDRMLIAKTAALLQQLQLP